MRGGGVQARAGVSRRSINTTHRGAEVAADGVGLGEHGAVLEGKRGGRTLAGGLSSQASGRGNQRRRGGVGVGFEEEQTA